MAIDSESGVLIKSATIEAGSGVPQAAEVKSWIDQQIPFENFAGKIQKLDNDVTTYVEGQVTAFRSAMMSAYARWADSQSVSNGESLAAEYEDDIHVPETAKMLRGKTAQMEDYIWNQDPPFSTEGVKSEMSRMKAMILSSYILRNLELAGYKNYIRPVNVDAELTGWCAIKVKYERVLEEIVERRVEYTEKKGKMVMRDERRLKKALVIDGPMLEQVDPFRLIVDLDCGQVHKCAYVGDESDQFVHELMKQAELGLYSKSQVEKLEVRSRENDSHSEIEFHDMARRSRSVTAHWDQQKYMESNRGARRVRCTELWCLYDFRDGYDGVTHPDGRRITGVQRVVITVAGKLALQFRLNPFDKKFAPYGIGRVNANGHEMVNTAPFDLVTDGNAVYDRYWSSVIRHAELSVDPIILTGNDTDLPDSLLGVRAGSIFRHVGQLEQIKIVDLPTSVPFMVQHFRREHEESSGYLRVWESTPETATETERKVQEAAQLIKPDVRAVADMWRQVGLIIYWLCGQFDTQARRFRVIGKASKMLGSYAVVTPDMLQEDIDIRFHGLDSMQTRGQKIAALKQWMNSWGPLLPTMPDVNLTNAAMIDFEYSVGSEYTDQIFKGRTPEWMLWTQEEENWMLDRGEEVDVNEADDDIEHLEHMVPRMRGIEKKPFNVQRAYLRHYDWHVRSARRKEMQRREEMQRQQEEAQALGTKQGVTPGQSKPASPGGMPAQGKGTTNGPTQSRTVARTGRDGMGISQQQRMETG